MMQWEGVHENQVVSSGKEPSISTEPIIDTK